MNDNVIRLASPEQKSRNRVLRLTEALVGAAEMSMADNYRYDEVVQALCAAAARLVHQNSDDADIQDIFNNMMERAADALENPDRWRDSYWTEEIESEPSL